MRKLLLVTIILSSTQQIRIVGFPLSLFQTMIIITFALGFMDIFRKKKISSGYHLIYVFVGLVSSLVAYFISTYETWAKSYLLLGIMSSVLIFFIVEYFDYRDADILSYALIKSQYITIPVSIYSLIGFYTNDMTINDISIGPFVFELADTFERVGQAAGQIRLFAPYHTGPVLSVVMAMSIMVLLFNRSIYSAKVRAALIVVFTIIMIFTGSRTALAALGITLGLYEMANLHYKVECKTVLFGIIGFIAVIVIFSYISDSEYIATLTHRFSLGNLFENRHLLVPLDGIIIWLSSLRNFVVGIGFGSSYHMEGVHTYLPPYFLNNYVTLVAERGIMGLVMVCILVFVCVKGFRKALKTTSNGERALWMALCCGLIAGIFYETINCYYIIIVLGIGFMLDKKKVYDCKKCEVSYECISDYTSL